ncbi:hypothetical protein KKP91_01945 [Methanothermococcus sp. SCGC AD-155-M21]|nr:hypothetical protein [Methanothermococcus sp. SCGC AD-155-M21]
MEAIELIKLISASIICWINFVIVDIYFGLPKNPGVSGAEVIGNKIEKLARNITGRYFMGNIVCSPDASAGTLMASIFYYVMGVKGGLIASMLIFIGNRLCNDPGYAGTIGAITATILMYVFSGLIEPKYFIGGMVIAIFTIQGLYHIGASKLLGNLAKKLRMI